MEVDEKIWWTDFWHYSVNVEGKVRFPFLNCKHKWYPYVRRRNGIVVTNGEISILNTGYKNHIH